MLAGDGFRYKASWPRKTTIDPATKYQQCLGAPPSPRLCSCGQGRIVRKQYLFAGCIGPVALLRWLAPLVLTGPEDKAGVRQAEKGIPGDLCSLLNRPQVSGNLPALRLGKARPRRHSVAHVALAQKPLDVAVACRAQPFTVKRGPLVPVSSCVGLVTLLAVLAIDQFPGRSRFGLSSERIGAGVIPGRHSLPARTGNRAYSHRGAQPNQENSKAPSHHSAPPSVSPWEPWNQLPI